MHLAGVTIAHDRFPTRDHYPFNLPVLQVTEHIRFDTPVTFFVGENGAGKSTLLRALCEKCNIHIWEGMSRTACNVNPYARLLFRAIDVEWIDGSVPGSYFDSQVFRNFAQLVDDWAKANPRTFDRYGGKSLVTQSHGQSLMSYFESRYQIKGLYLMDEPETALSPASQLLLLQLLHKMGRAGHAQFIVATHSPILLACPGAHIYSFDHEPVKSLVYEETAYFRVYGDFLANREKYLARLDDDLPLTPLDA